MDSTQDYVSNARQSREYDVRELLDAEGAGREVQDGDPGELLDELPLSVETERHVVIVLSTGGPHEQIDAEVDGKGFIVRATFLAVWGSDRRETPLSEGDALWTLAERFVDLV